MKKRILIVLCLFGIVSLEAQNTEKENLKNNEELLKKMTEERPHGWVKKGVITLLASQSSFSNWLAGGQNSVSGTANANYDFNYKSDHWTWDNKFILAYGINKIKGSEALKTDDRLEFNSLAGRKGFGEHWYYSLFFNFKTQMDTGLDPETQSYRYTHFFSPAYFMFGPGLLWKKSENFKINIAPVTSRLIVVHGHFTDGLPVGYDYFGVEPGKSMRYELGAALNGYFKYEIMPNVSLENILNLYSNYLEDPQNVDIDYQLNIAMKINKYLTTNFSFQAIYDDNAFRGFQTRQILGVGATYGFQ